jgi:hypothetical protein
LPAGRYEPAERNLGLRQGDPRCRPPLKPLPLKQLPLKPLPLKP